MALVAGLSYKSDLSTCAETWTAACTASGYSVSSTRCIDAMASVKVPYACLLGTVDPCPEPTDPFGLSSIDAGLISYMFLGSIFLWAIGFGLGLMLAVIRKAR